MLAHQFPDLDWLKRQADTDFANRRSMDGRELPTDGWPSVVMNATSRDVVRDNIRGPLSLFTNWSGKSTLTVDKKRVTLSPETFFVSNSGQYYTLEIHEDTPTATANVHFGEQFSREALRCMPLAADQLLENHSGNELEIPAFQNRVATASPEFRNIIGSLIRQGMDSAEEEQLLFQLLSLLTQEESALHHQQEKLMALKSSTKIEIMKRLVNVTDYLYTTYDVSPSLDELAAISCLSKFHFLRLFKLAHGKTPHQFILSLRVNRAKELLKRTSDDVKSIADTLGFESSASFSRAFRREAGVYPSQYRSLL